MGSLSDPNDFKPVVIEVVDGEEVETPVGEWLSRCLK